MSAIKVKAKLKGNVIKVKALAKHAMTTYNMMEKKTGNRDDANFIEHIAATINGETVFDMSTSQFLSKNPIFKFEVKADGFKKGDKIEMIATDRKNKTLKGKGKVK